MNGGIRIAKRLRDSRIWPRADQPTAHGLLPTAHCLLTACRIPADSECGAVLAERSGQTGQRRGSSRTMVTVMASWRMGERVIGSSL